MLPNAFSSVWALRACGRYPGTAMKLKLAMAAMVLVSGGAHAQRVPPIRNPVLLNIGFVCKWQNLCIKRQQAAMASGLKYLKTHSVPAWKVRQCNRNSSRGGTRKDWVGFNNCVRNPALRPPARRSNKR